MKKLFVVLFVIAIVAFVVAPTQAQVTIPASSATLKFVVVKDSIGDFLTDWNATLKKGYGKAFSADSVTLVSEVWTITGVPGRTADQELVFYTRAGVETCDLFQKGTLKFENGKLAGIFGDSPEAKALFGK